MALEQQRSNAKCGVCRVLFFAGMMLPLPAREGVRGHEVQGWDSEFG